MYCHPDVLVAAWDLRYSKHRVGWDVAFPPPLPSANREWCIVNATVMLMAAKTKNSQQFRTSQVFMNTSWIH